MKTRREEVKAEIARLREEIESLEVELGALPERWKPSKGEWCVTASGRTVKPSEDAHINRGATCNTKEAADRRIELITAVMRLDRWVEENGERGGYTVAISAVNKFWYRHPCTLPTEIPMSYDTASRAAEALNDGTLVLSVDD